VIRALPFALTLLTCCSCTGDYGPARESLKQWVAVHMPGAVSTCLPLSLNAIRCTVSKGDAMHQVKCWQTGCELEIVEP
jgi:hypothetical protein